VAFLGARRSIFLFTALSSALLAAAACGDDDPAPVTPADAGRDATVDRAPPPPPPVDASLDDATADAGVETFGTKGYVTTSFGEAWDVPGNVARQSDGKLLLAGTTLAGNDVLLARFDANGVLDPSFGQGGAVITPMTGSGLDDSRVATGVGVQKDGHVVVTAKSDTHGVLLRYSSGGVLEDRKDLGVASPLALAIMPDDRIVVAGGDVTTLLVMRLLANGSPDTTWNGTGRATMGWPPAKAVAVDPSGNVVVASNITDRVVVPRFNSAGKLDTTWSGSGTATITVGTQADVRALTLAQDGRVVVVGGFEPQFNEKQMFAFRLAANGTPEDSFGGVDGGVVKTDLPDGNETAIGASLLPGGEIMSGVARGSFFTIARYGSDGMLESGLSQMKIEGHTPVGQVLGPNGTLTFATQLQKPLSDIALVRRLSNGSPDTTFGTNGVAALNLRCSADDIVGLGVQDDGKIVAAGNVRSSGERGWNLVRYLPSGAIDPTFGTDGRVQRIGNNTRIGSVGIDKQGGIVVSGDGNVGMFAGRFTAAGQPDPAFGAREFKIYDDKYARPRGMAFDANGRIVLGGFTDSESSRWDFAVMRLDGTTGQLDPTFAGGAGKRSIEVSLEEDRALALALQSDGKIVLAGSTANGSRHDLALARLLDTGEPDPTFGGATGVVKSNATGIAYETARALAVQPDGRILVVGDARSVPPWTYDIYVPPAGTSSLLVARFLATGTLDSSFASNGVFLDALGSNATGLAAALQTDGKILVAGRRWNGATEDGFVVRLLPTGALDTTFGTAGVRSFTLGNESGLSALALGAGVIYAGGFIHQGTTGSDFALLRLEP
jgi:uncharacterized delta-60 repeat protein